MNKLIITIIIIFVVGGVGTAIYFFIETNKFPFEKGDKNTKQRGDFYNEQPDGIQMMNLTEDQISEIMAFFDSNPSNSEIKIYCEEDRISCRYYCMKINPKNDYCENITPPNREDKMSPEGMENPPK